MKTIQEQETEAILSQWVKQLMHSNNNWQMRIDESKNTRTDTCNTASKIVEFAKVNPPSYKVKVAEAPAHIGYET
jgi:hypothetical protein